MHPIKPTLLAAALGLLALGAAGSAGAGIDNGGFEAGLTGWTTAGDVAQDGGLGGGPTEGTAQVLMTTALDDGDDTSGSDFNASGQAPAQVGIADGLEEQLGLAIGDLDGFFADLPTEGSGIARTFTAPAGSRLSFDWALLTNDDLSADFAFVAIDGIVSVLIDSLDATLLTGSGDYAAETGIQSFLSEPFAAGGLHRLVIGVVDAGDYLATSALIVDNLQVVPAPAVAWLLLLGLPALAARARR